MQLRSPTRNFGIQVTLIYGLSLVTVMCCTSGEKVVGLAFRGEVKSGEIHTSTPVPSHGIGAVASGRTIRVQFLRKYETDGCTGAGADDFRGLRVLP